MTGLSLLLVWIALGIVTAACVPSPGESRWAWASMAAVVGPLWLCVALDRRTLAEAEEVGVDRTDGMTSFVYIDCDYQQTSADRGAAA